METTPDKHCIWEVDVDYLEEALGEIHRHGSTVIAVTPYESSCVNDPKMLGTSHSKVKVTSYLIVYYNLPLTAIPGMPGSGDPATIQ